MTRAGNNMIEKSDAARRQMIDQQVRGWDVLDPRVLEALAAVPREHFVPEAYRGVAFADTAIPIGHGEFMLRPRIEGRILQALGLDRGERVLEVGTGTGFFAACLEYLSGDVESIEIHAALADGAARALERLGVTRVRVACADALDHSFEPHYQAIAVTGSMPVYDPRFERALAVGGRLFVVVGSQPVMEARLVTRTAVDAWLSETLFETCIEPLCNTPPAALFHF
ncbi:MAG: protein-L-isoaspartate O-methyltransferase [Gammaproteobacteria bacterium]|nr:protein-L-isoaspartate O-methyltransferase [Gammaproteobacteria bacterium]